MPDWLQEAREIAPEIRALREAIHRRPELGNREYETAALVEQTLKDCGLTVRRMLDTAVVGRLEGALPGPAVAIRADMDALPIREATGADFTSACPGLMHACGHDVHTAAALGAAKLLAAHRDRMRGTALFLFQPDEEGSGGAARMIAAGALEDAEAIFGCHVSPELPAGHAGVRSGKFYAASDTFRVVLTGKSAHGAEREKGLDALAAAAELVTKLLALPAETPEERSVVSVGTLSAGTAVNILADHAELSGILRTLGPENRERMRRRVKETVRDVEDETGVRAALELRESYPGVVNDGEMTDYVQRTAAALLGARQVHVLDQPTMTTEDFGYYLMERPGCFYHVGAGCPLPLHNAAFLPDGEAAVTAAALHAALVWAYTSKKQ